MRRFMRSLRLALVMVTGLAWSSAQTTTPNAPTYPATTAAATPDAGQPATNPLPTAQASGVRQVTVAAGTLYGDPGTRGAKTDEEGSVKTDTHDKLKKAPAAAGKGAAIGSLGGILASGTLNGLRIGGGIGAAVGLASVLLTRGPDVRIEPGAAFTIKLERPLVVDVIPSASVQAGSQLVPRPTENRLPLPTTNSNPK